MKRKDWRFWLAILLLVALAIGACGKICTATSLCQNDAGEYKQVSRTGSSCPSCPSGYHLVECVVSCYEEGE